MPSLVLGPMLRYVGSTDATVWVETSEACKVAVNGQSARTFQVEGHHYALVLLTGLEPAREYPYTVSLDGDSVWPEPESDFPASVIRTLDPARPLRLAFGSCRVTAPQVAPYTLLRERDARGRGIDALFALALAVRDTPTQAWPDALLLLGDQVYADDVSPATKAFIRSRRDPDEPPGEEVVDFEEYTALYCEAWSDPTVRWLLSTIPSAMVFDDHDVNDDWNTSAAWLAAQRAQPWWAERIVGGLVSYWIYQHLGNLSPRQLEENEQYHRVREVADAGPLLRRFAEAADRDPETCRWSFYRDFGHTRLVVIDSRAGRVLGEGRRAMVDDAEWAWVERHATGGFDHLLLGTSLPFIVGPAIHHMEAWNEAVCAGAWGRRAAGLAERMRQAIDLEHWSAFGYSFERMTDLVYAVASGERGPPPASLVVLSGDVHHAYVARAQFPGRPVRSAVYQAVCSPLRNALARHQRRVMRLGWSRAVAGFWRALGRLAGARVPGLRWQLVHDEPWFDTQVARLELDGDGATFVLESPVADKPGAPALREIFRYRLVGA